MKHLVLRCNLMRCNVDGSEEMSLEKCVLRNDSPCYYLLYQSREDGHPDQVWQRFGSFVNSQIKGTGK
ncbi:MAG: hypothetical protein ACK4HQ_07630 [Brevinematales bacterium]